MEELICKAVIIFWCWVYEFQQYSLFVKIYVIMTHTLLIGIVCTMIKRFICKKRA